MPISTGWIHKLRCEESMEYYTTAKKMRQLFCSDTSSFCLRWSPSPRYPPGPLLQVTFHQWGCPLSCHIQQQLVLIPNALPPPALLLLYFQPSGTLPLFLSCLSSSRGKKILEEETVWSSAVNPRPRTSTRHSVWCSANDGWTMGGWMIWENSKDTNVRRVSVLLVFVF